MQKIIFQGDKVMEKKFSWKDASDETMRFWKGIYTIQKDWKEENRDKDFDEFWAEYERRQQLDKELNDPEE